MIVMNSTKETTRRSFLSLTAYAMGAFGIGAAAWALIDSMNPAADAWARVTDVNLKSIQPGQRTMVVWEGKPIFIFHRTKDDIREVRAEDWWHLRDRQRDEDRVQEGHDEWLVVIGVCTHLGCIVKGNRSMEPRGGWGGWLCPCCGSSYDKSGRVRVGPAPKNLHVPIYSFLTDDLIRLGGRPAHWIRP